MRKAKTTRRDFLKKAAVAGAGAMVVGTTGCSLFRPRPRIRSANEKLDIACIGVGGRGYADLKGVSSENIVALCDVDDERAKRAYEEFPKAKRYHDFRRMFDELHDKIDAVTIATPDHMHALPAMIAMSYGRHVYCEKPLTHDVWEARRLAEMSRDYGVATQMGNQGTSIEGFRRGVEAIRSGVLGDVREVHVWTNRPVWPQGMARPTGTPAVPETLKWDLWVGTAPLRAYNPAYLPFNWRGWWDFGTGALGDMGCHTANLAFMGLDLGSPLSAEAENSPFSRDSFPTWSVITLNFPARGAKPPVRWTWYDGSDKKPAWVIEKLKSLTYGKNLAGSGLVLVGDKGSLYSPNDYGAEWHLLPEENFKGWTPPEPTLPRSPGHHQEWIEACKGGPPAMSNFSYGGPLAEALLLGNVAMYAGQMVLFDGANCRITNSELGDSLLRRHYREGWSA